LAIRLTRYLRLQILSVLLPGMIVVAESALVLHPASAEQKRRFLASLPASSVPSFNRTGIVVTAVLVLAIAFIAAFIWRLIAFKIIFYIERVASDIPTAGRGSLTHRILARLSGSAAPSVRRLTHEFGSDTASGRQIVEQAFSGHPVNVLQSCLTSEGADSATSSGKPSSRSREPVNEIVPYAYCKLWLRRYEPTLSKDNLEFEINILVAFIPPVLFGTFTINALYIDGIWQVVVAVLGLMASMVMYVSAMFSRYDERFEVFRNFIFAQSFRLQDEPDAFESHSTSQGRHAVGRMSSRSGASP
jgi:hypothetical protein